MEVSSPFLNSLLLYSQDYKVLFLVHKPQDFVLKYLHNAQKIPIIERYLKYGVSK